MLKLNRDHVTIAPVNIIKWNESEGAFTRFSKSADVPLREPFAIDVWSAQHGYEVWTDKVRTEVLRPVSSEMPSQPAGKASAIYSVPIYSSEIGSAGGILIVKGKVATEAFCDLFDHISNDVTDDHPQIPIVSVTVDDSEFGLKPTFNLENVVDRPSGWKTPIVSFS